MAVVSYFDAQLDPANNAIYPYTIRSDSKGGSTTGTLSAPDLTISTAANFPSTDVGTPTRWFCTLPMNAYRTSTNSSAFTVRNETQGRDLTVVEPTATLTDYTCKFFAITSERANILEVHQGSTSNQAGDILSFEGKFVGTILTSTYIAPVYVTSSGTSSNVYIRDRIVEIGPWVMTTAYIYKDVNIGVSGTSIRSADIIIYGEEGTAAPLSYETSPYTSPGGTFMAGNSTSALPSLRMFLSTGGLFCQMATVGVSYNTTTINRGLIYLRTQE